MYKKNDKVLYQGITYVVVEDENPSFDGIFCCEVGLEPTRENVRYFLSLTEYNRVVEGKDVEE